MRAKDTNRGDVFILNGSLYMLVKPFTLEEKPMIQCNAINLCSGSAESIDTSSEITFFDSAYRFSKYIIRSFYSSKTHISEIKSGDYFCDAFNGKAYLCLNFKGSFGLPMFLELKSAKVVTLFSTKTVEKFVNVKFKL